ncbi:hypothetical protein BDN72DRAFT_373986 [Pluteus cervinus]|uniref:Uncharacterized protein n=1 Tax=Pluteus cervinus TaxID=181527 RepID=A0ACD3B2Y3_9AGAR|nr:hypothetical protein BDN72DRAFT_373986 [Pluteus cervinus]
MTSLKLNSLSKIATRSPTLSVQFSRRWVHETRPHQAIMMPAMSPLMTEGTVRRWKKKEGEAFLPGDVLLQIESDIAMIDVQAENAGIITKILIPDGTTHVRVEEVIALVAKDAQEYARLQAQSNTQPSPPQSLSQLSNSPPRRTPSPIHFDQSSVSRSPSGPRSPFRYQAHINTTPPSMNAATSTGAVRGMVTNHVRTMSLPGLPPPGIGGSATTTSTTSSISGNNSNVFRYGSPPSTTISDNIRIRSPPSSPRRHTLGSTLPSTSAAVAETTRQVGGIHPLRRSESLFGGIAEERREVSLSFMSILCLSVPVDGIMGSFRFPLRPRSTSFTSRLSCFTTCVMLRIRAMLLAQLVWMAFLFFPLSLQAPWSRDQMLTSSS